MYWVIGIFIIVGVLFIFHKLSKRKHRHRYWDDYNDEDIFG